MLTVNDDIHVIYLNIHAILLRFLPPYICLWQDGCDFVCRSRNRDEPPAYRGVATEPLEDEPEERDDHLLPMWPEYIWNGTEISTVWHSSLVQRSDEVATKHKSAVRFTTGNTTTG